MINVKVVFIVNSCISRISKHLYYNQMTKSLSKILFKPKGKIQQTMISHHKFFC